MCKLCYTNSPTLTGVKYAVNCEGVAVFFVDASALIAILLFKQEERQRSPWYSEFGSAYSERLGMNG